ncbi:hypothetical protein [Pseudodesulfovibrio sp.]|uniref:hypothetical protein n=1 Tax=Pseudodesulfovibrio sp. TaxID=2035812 RepID=UPI00261A8449|nr:hypothetical protein [Pseudodesulfovibrio sp.]MDD3313870.1 hypothetical protein [Pseudodesulfovibrio sp.]
MKQYVPLMAACVLLLCLGACKRNAATILPMPDEYVGEYLETSDVLRIGAALDRTAPRIPVKWENPETGYQFSMMVFSSDSAKGATTSRFSVLAIEPSGQAELLALLGRSSKKGVWHIVAESSASPVGKAQRMRLDPTPMPEATLNTDHFSGFLVER